MVIRLLKEPGENFNKERASCKKTETTKNEPGTKNLREETATENLPDLAKDTDTQAQEAQRVPNKMHPSRPPPRHADVSNHCAARLKLTESHPEKHTNSRKTRRLYGKRIHYLGGSAAPTAPL